MWLWRDRWLQGRRRCAVRGETDQPQQEHRRTVLSDHHPLPRLSNGVQKLRPAGCRHFHRLQHLLHWHGELMMHSGRTLSKPGHILSALTVHLHICDQGFLHLVFHNHFPSSLRLFKRDLQDFFNVYYTLCVCGCVCVCVCVYKSNQITFIVTWPQHMCLGEWNSWERAQKQFTYRQYILTDLYRRQCAEYTYIYSVHTVYY